VNKFKIEIVGDKQPVRLKLKYEFGDWYVFNMTPAEARQIAEELIVKAHHCEHETKECNE
jgi:hypothetical protein